MNDRYNHTHTEKMINIFSEILFQEFGYHNLSNSDFIEFIGKKKKKEICICLKQGWGSCFFLYPLHFIKSIWTVIQ